MAVLSPTVIAATSTEIKVGKDKYIQKIAFFENYNIGATYGTTTGYVYDTPTKTTIDDGWINAGSDPLAKSTKITLQIGVNSIASGTRTVRIEGRGGNPSRPFEILTLNYTSPTTMDNAITIEEAVTDIRVGLACTATTADSVSVYALIEKSE